MPLLSYPAAMREAPMERTEYGLTPVTEGWFAVNVREATWMTNEKFGEACLIEGEERRLRAWDFVHCPAGTEHIFVGAGKGPCVIFMAGGRAHRGSAVYPRAEAALRHGAGVEAETDQPYSPFPKWRAGPPATF